MTASTTTIPREARECLAPGAAVIPQPTAPQDQGPGAVPGQGPTFLGPFRNQVLSDVPSNMDYSFRAGLFMGDYNNVAYPNLPGDSRSNEAVDDRDNDDRNGVENNRKAVGFWTDARNGRGSGGPTSLQPGRNPACEQSDVFVDFFNPLHQNDGQRATQQTELFLVTPCPTDAQGKRDKHTTN